MKNLLTDLATSEVISELKRIATFVGLITLGWAMKIGYLKRKNKAITKSMLFWSYITALGVGVGVDQIFIATGEIANMWRSPSAIVAALLSEDIVTTLMSKEGRRMIIDWFLNRFNLGRKNNKDEKH
jgi:putative Mn2+ efflux pump MntP